MPTNRFVLPRTCWPAASRAYYAAFYAASALLLDLGLETSKHGGVIALIHQHYVRTGKLSQAHGRMLNRLFNLRSVADYGVTVHVSAEEAQRAIDAARQLVEAAVGLLDRSGEEAGTSG